MSAVEYRQLNKIVWLRRKILEVAMDFFQIGENNDCVRELRKIKIVSFFSYYSHSAKPFAHLSAGRLAGQYISNYRISDKNLERDDIEFE